MALKFEAKSFGIHIESVAEYLNEFRKSNKLIEHVSVTSHNGFHVVVGYKE